MRNNKSFSASARLRFPIPQCKISLRMIESQTAPELETLTETGHFLRASVRT